MKGIKLSGRVRYLSMRDENGSFGLMFLVPENPSEKPKTVTVETAEQFEEALYVMKLEEQFGKDAS